MVLAYIIVMSSLYMIFTYTYILPQRYHSPPTEQDIDFWSDVMGEIRNASTLNVTLESSRFEEISGLKINVTHYKIFSEGYGGRDIWIHVVVMYNGDLTPKPGVLLVHGYGGDWTIFEDYMIELVKHGYVAVALDAPGAGGESTDFPPDDSKYVVNTSDGPEYGYFYHVAYAVMRTITFMETLSFIDSSKIFVGGVSMGGIMSLIVGAVDDRILAAIPIVAAGNYLDSILSGSFANGLAPKDVSLDSKEAINMIRYFDVYAYASKIEKPILYVAVTNDEYFNIVAFNDTYNVIPSKQKTLVIWPNSDHYGYPYWDKKLIDVVLEWLRYVLHGARFPSVGVPSISLKNYVLFKKVEIQVEAEPCDKDVLLVSRGSIALAEWKIHKMYKQGDKYVGSITVSTKPKIALYVAIGEVKGGLWVIYASTPVFIVSCNPLLLPTIIGVSIVMIFVLEFLLLKRKPLDVLNSLIGTVRERWYNLFVWVVATVSIFSPAINVAGRTHIGVWELLERIYVLLECYFGIPVVSPSQIIALAAIFLLLLLSMDSRKLLIVYPILILILPHLYTILAVMFLGERLGIAFSVAFYMVVVSLVLAIAEILYPRIIRIAGRK